MPDEVQWLLPIVVGESWPEGDEDELRRIADAWRQAAEGIDAVLADADQGARLAKASMEGATAQAFAELWAKVGDGGEAALAKLRDACHQNGQACDKTALEIEHTKLTIIFSLVALLIQIAIMVGAAFVSGGVSTAGILPAQMLTRTAVQMVFRQLIISILRNMAIEFGTSVAIEGVVQGIQIGEGERKGLDGEKLGQAAVSGAIGGVAGGVVEAGFAAKSIAKGFGETAGEAAGDGASAAASRAASEVAGETGSASLGEAVKSAGRAAGREAVEGATEGAVGSAAEQALTGEKPFSWEQVGKGAVSGGVTGSVMGGAVDGAHSLADARSASAAAASAADAANAAGSAASAADAVEPEKPPRDNVDSALPADRGDSGRSSIMDALDPVGSGSSSGHEEVSSSTSSAAEELPGPRPSNVGSDPSGTAAQSIAPPTPPAPSTDAPVSGGQPGTTGTPAGHGARDVQQGTPPSSGAALGSGTATGAPGASPSVGGNTPSGGTSEKATRSPSASSTPMTPSTPGRGPVQGGPPAGGGPFPDTARRPSTLEGPAPAHQPGQHPTRGPHGAPEPTTHWHHATASAQPGGAHTPTHGDPRQQARLAHNAYERIRHDPRDVDDIAETLARTNPELGLRRQDVEEVKKHLFFDPVLVETPSGQAVLRSKDPDPYIAEAWNRLRNGTPDETDIGLLRHEQAEIAYLRRHPNTPIHEAHEHANQAYNWESRVPELARAEIEAIQEITDGRPSLFHEDPRGRTEDLLPHRIEAAGYGPDLGFRQGDRSSYSAGRQGRSPIPGRDQEDHPGSRRAGNMAGGRDAYELNVEHDPRDNRFAVGDSPSRQSGREFVSGGRIGDWRENRARHNEIRKDFYRWQSAKATADKLAREYIEAKESVRPGIADKRFERFQTARKALRDFAEELGFGGLADESGKRWKRFQRLFGDDPESGTPRVFADETDHKITGDIPGRTSGDSTSAKDDESTATEEAYRAAAVWENYCFAETEPDRIKAADELIEYMENLGLDDLSNWESFAGNWSHPHKNLFFGRIAEAAAEYFDLPLDQLEAAADEVAISQNGKASFGEATTRDYRKTFRDAYPDTRGRVVVHHAVEQGVLSKFPGVVSPSEIHSLENLRGIPKGSVNNEVHLSAIRREWNRFYKPFLRDGTRPTKQELLDFATYIDDKYGDQFNPPIR